MKKRHMITAVGAGVISVGALSYLMMKDEQKTKIKGMFDNVFHKENGQEFSTLEKSGLPDQLGVLDDTVMENAKMVSEGSQYGVHYFNEMQENHLFP